jgi:hypothetical protein
MSIRCEVKSGFTHEDVIQMSKDIIKYIIYSRNQIPTYIFPLSITSFDFDEIKLLHDQVEEKKTSGLRVSLSEKKYYNVRNSTLT